MADIGDRTWQEYRLQPPWSHCQHLVSVSCWNHRHSTLTSPSAEIHSPDTGDKSRSFPPARPGTGGPVWHFLPGSEAFRAAQGRRVWWLADSAWTTGRRTPCRPIKASSIMVAMSGSLPSTVCRDEDGAPRKLIGHGTLQAENKLSGAGRQRRLISLRLGWSSSTT